MKTSQAPGNRTEQTARSALLFVLVGAAIVSGVGVAAIRRRSRKAPDQVQYEGRRVGNVMGTGGDAIENPLVGHEFRFRIYGRRHRMHILQSARQTDSGALRGRIRNVGRPRGRPGVVFGPWPKRGWAAGRPPRVVEPQR
jgi:hypothetical protein